MTAETQQLREYLAYYGADMDTWPEHARILGRRLAHDSECAALIASESRFEAMLQTREVESSTSDLAARIIARARPRASALPKKPQQWFSELVATVNPAALAASLLLGVALGFGSYTAIPHSAGDSALQFNTDDEGTAP